MLTRDLHRCLATFLALLCTSPLALAQGRLDGVVVNVLGEPIPLAKLQLDLPGRPTRTATADANGCFAFASLPLRATLRLVASADGHQPQQVERELSDQHREHFDRLCLPDAEAVQGRVVDASGAPIVGALVMFEDGAATFPKNSEAPLAARYAITDTNGSYRLSSSPVGRVRLAAVARGFGLARTAPFRLAAPIVRDFTLSPCPTATFRIGVTGASREQLARLRAEPYLAEVQLPLGQLWPHHRDGDRLVYADLPVGLVQQFDLHIDGVVLQSQLVSAPQAAGAHDLDAAVEPASVPLRGRLCDPEGIALPGIRVVERLDAELAAATTDTEGRFRWDTTPGADKHCLEIDSHEYVLHTAHEDAAVRILQSGTCWTTLDQTGGVVLLASRPATVRGKIVDSSGAPVRDGVVMLLAKARDTTSPPATVPLYLPWKACCCGSDGSFEMQQLDALFTDPLWLFVVSPLGELSQPFAGLKPGACLDVGIVRLPATASIEGVVADAAGTPLAGTTVSIFRVSPDPGVNDHLGEWDVVANRTGRFRAMGLPAGEYAVRCADQLAERDEEMHDVRVRLKAGECKRLAPRVPIRDARGPR